MISISLDKLFIISVFATYIQEVNSLYGYPCNYDLSTDIYQRSHELTSCPERYEVCKDHRCQCEKYLFYDDGKAKCRYIFLPLNNEYFLRGYLDNCLYKCRADQKCLSTNCVCRNETHVQIEDKCIEPVYQGVMEKCYVSEKAYICNATANSHCVKGQCKCFPKFDYNETTKECLTTFKELTAEYCYMRCRDDQKCVKENKCVCQNETYVEINKTCTAPIIQSPMEKCHISDRAYTCNETAHTHCIKTTCLCLPTYYYNTTVRECLTKKSYTDHYGIKDYKALPGGYCTQNGECIEGLHCQSFNCSCPFGCSYKAKDFVCDCGTVELQTPSDVIALGILFGLLSLLFWTFLIRRTINNAKKNPRTDFVRIPITELNPVIPPDSISHPDPVPLSRPPPEDNQPIKDLPPSYDDAMRDDALRASAPIGFCGQPNPYLLKPILTDNPSVPPAYPLASAPLSPDDTTAGPPPYPLDKLNHQMRP